MGIRERPQRCVEADGAHSAHELACRLEPVAIDPGDVCADCGVFEDVAVVDVAGLDFEFLGFESFDQCTDFRILRIGERDHLQQLVEGDRDRRRLGAVFHHLRLLQALHVKDTVVLFRALDSFAKPGKRCPYSCSVRRYVSHGPSAGPTLSPGITIGMPGG